MTSSLRKSVTFTDVDGRRWIVPLRNIMAVSSNSPGDLATYTHILLTDGTWVGTPNTLEDVWTGILAEEAAGE